MRGQRKRERKKVCACARARAEWDGWVHDLTWTAGQLIDGMAMRDDDEEEVDVVVMVMMNCRRRYVAGMGKRGR